MKKQKTTSIQSLQQQIQILQKQIEEGQAETILLNHQITLQQEVIENQKQIITGFNTLIEILKQRYPNIREEIEHPEKPR